MSLRRLERYNPRMSRLSLFLLLSVFPALPVLASRQDIALIEAQARAFALQGWQGAAVRLSYGQLDRRLGLPACPSPVLPGMVPAARPPVE